MAPPRPPTATVQHALDRYRLAFNALDPWAARLVWPSVDPDALTRAFDQLREQTLVYDDCHVSFTGERALASCSGTLRYVPRLGRGQPRVEPRRWDFHLRATGDSWIIEAVDSR